MTRHAMRLLAVLTVLAASLLSPVTTSSPAQQAEAADLRYFDPGNIISDGVFFDGLAMNAGQIQEFLNAKGASCRGGTDGTACLKNYSMETFGRAADSLCDGYKGARRETAAVVIAKVAASCGVSPRVLLVLLEKEMGLVRTTNPTAKKYDRAAGYACPDNVGGWCNPEYAGLQNQLYRSAWQYQRYAANASSYSYRAGRNNVILWHPTASCGSSTVYIANQATAGLYNYTPYRPNQAALNAGYGTGDKCSSYGNRNFWNFFTDWFGSTQSTGGSAITLKQKQLVAAGIGIGSATSPLYCGLVEGGCYQVFAGGTIYWSPASGTWSTSGAIQGKWGTIGLEWGKLGYPVSDPACGLRDGGCFQVFQRGSIYSSPASGAHAVVGGIRNKWQALGWELSSLGYPVMDESCGLVGGGCYQAFQGGTLYWSPASGTHFVSGAIRDRWNSTGNEWGSLGYPISDTQCGLKNNGCYQVFQKGSLYSSPATGTHYVWGGMASRWRALGAENGPLGYPLTDERCGLVGKGCYQMFEGGTQYWTAGTGARFTSGAIRARWSALGNERSPLGYPTSDTLCGLVDNGCYQFFQQGSLYSSPATGTSVVWGGIASKWRALGAENGRLGYPLTDERCGLSGGTDCSQVFEGGALYWSSAGTRVIDGAIGDRWKDLGSEQVAMGRPSNDSTCGLVGGGCYQQFANGSLYWSPDTGTSVVRGAIRNSWARTGSEAGPLGYPIVDEHCGIRDDGCFQHYERGSIYWTAAIGAHPVSGPIRDAWVTQGYEAGPWGYPVAAPTPSAGGTVQRFERGTATFTTATGQVTFTQAS